MWGLPVPHGRTVLPKEEPVADSEELAVIHSRLGFEGEEGGDPEMSNQNDWRNSEADA